MKVTFVTPRYGAEILGGAEYAARMLAERLVERPGWNVNVFSSCALDATTWADHYRPGIEQVNGVGVRRFPVTHPRHEQFLHTSMKVHARPTLASEQLQERWIDQQGPTTPGLLDALQSDDSDVFVFYPYLYYPTVRGLPLVADKAVLHPAAHDEPSIRMSIFAKTFGSAAGLVFQTDAERRLSESLFPIAHHRQLLLGLGVDSRPGDEEGFRRRFGLGDGPYLLCLGRVDEGKGSTLLARYFTEYKKRCPSGLKLVFVGTTKDKIETHPDVVVTGAVSDDFKWGALHGCEVLVSPSAYEAFSLALVEGWSAEKPVIVNGACIATREHVERSSGGLWFTSYLAFEAALDKLVDTDGKANSQAAAVFAKKGRAYVEERFSWPALIDRYGEFLTDISSRSANRTSMKEAS